MIRLHSWYQQIPKVPKAYSSSRALTYLRLRLDRALNAVGHLLEQNAGTATSLQSSWVDCELKITCPQTSIKCPCDPCDPCVLALKKGENAQMHCINIINMSTICTGFTTTIIQSSLRRITIWTPTNSRLGRAVGGTTSRGPTGAPGHFAPRCAWDSPVEMKYRATWKASSWCLAENEGEHSEIQWVYHALSSFSL